MNFTERKYRIKENLILYFGKCGNWIKGRRK